MGYRLIKTFWGKGYATEIAFASIKYGQNVLQLKEIFGMANVENLASCRVLEKIGMKPSRTFYYEDIEHRWYQLTRE